MENAFLKAILDLLKANKSFPNYHAERRIDIFINFYLETVLTNYLNKKVEFICPEFPLKKEDSNRSTKLDYLCKTENEIIFVELKTDTKSFDLKQMKYYFNHSSWNPWEKYLKDILLVSKDKNYSKLDEKLKISGLYDNKEDLPVRVIYISPVLKDADKKRIQVENYQLLNFKYFASLTNGLNEYNSEWDQLNDFFESFKLGVFEIIKMN